MRAQERARTLLMDAQIPVYEPGQYAGQCKVPYVVVQCYGNYPTVQARRLTYTLLLVRCYVPLDGKQTEALAALAERVRAAMRPMRPQARPTGQEGPHMIEESYKALSCYIEYQILKRMD